VHTVPALDPSGTETIARFAQSMGLTALRNEDDSFGFEFADSGRLSLMSDDSGDAVLVSLTRRILLDDFVPLARLAAVSGYDDLAGVRGQAGLTRTGQPVLTATLARRDFDLPRLDALFSRLRASFAAQGL